MPLSKEAPRPATFPDSRTARRVRNRIEWRDYLARMQGSPVELDLRRYDEPLAEINGLGVVLADLPNEDLLSRVRQVRQQAAQGSALEKIRTAWFALVREVSRREVGLRPFDEQIIAALALDDGAVVDVQTGEGKTLAAVMPAALNALLGKGTHVLTFNDYLARRDTEWMGPIYRRLGLSVASVEHGTAHAARRDAYRADVTYVTAKEAGFDLLRDLLATSAGGLVHRGLDFALVDEADSLLIDEARVPLVIAGSIGRQTSSAVMLAALVASFEPGVHFDLDEYGRDVELTEEGIALAEEVLGRGSLHEERNYILLTELNCALHARALLRRDVDYLVRDGRIVLIDELTGRVVADRHWPDGLQAALEAKEGIERQTDGRILGSITLQHFLRQYTRVCGMSGTARAAAAELFDMYGLPVVVIPTHRPTIRIDRPDVVFTHRDAKECAVVREVLSAHASGRPVLVGTLTVEESERLANRLRSGGIACEVLNAKNDAAEARIIAGAGAAGAVTISTNMAGRGTDIRLGGANESGRDYVVELGGLYVIGTNRHESRRVDLQLRGRAGRQGDPGESRFFVSLEDEVLVQYGIRSLLGRFLPSRSGDPVDHPVVLREIARAQRIVEGQNFEIRKTLYRYSTVVEEQRQRVMTHRQALLTGEEQPNAWEHDPERRRALTAAVGEETVREAERLATLCEIDRAWREHLALVADVREGIHLVALGGHDPLTHFTRQIVAAFDQLTDRIDNAVFETLAAAVAKDGRVEMPEAAIKGPSSTWTYLVTDDPFQNRIGMLLTGPGRSTIALYSAAVLTPLLIAWTVVERMFRKKPVRTSGVSASRQ